MSRSGHCDGDGRSWTGADGRSAALAISSSFHASRRICQLPSETSTAMAASARKPGTIRARTLAATSRTSIDPALLRAVRVLQRHQDPLPGPEQTKAEEEHEGAPEHHM